MRILGVLCINLVLLTGLASAVMAGTEDSPFTPMANQLGTVSADQVVYPTGNHHKDVDNVQAAVDQGGTVLLKATNADGQPTAFEFGNGGGFYITDDVTIFGERSGSAMTTIRGGLAPVRCFAPVYLAVSGIHFEGPRSCAIYIGASAGADLSSNVITGVIGTRFAPKITKGQGIWIVALGGNPYAISGSIVIADNTIEDVDAVNGYGLALFCFGAEMTIVGNHISGMNTAGILAVLNTETVCVMDNIIVPGPEQYPGDYSGGVGIWGAWSLGGDYYFARNNIICENPEAGGIVVMQPYSLWAPVPEPEVVIERNHVTVHGSWWGGIELVDGVSGAYVGQNRIDGQNAYAIGVWAMEFPEAPMANNVFQVNDVSRFTANLAQYFLYFSTQNTVVLGNSGTVLDLGSGNRVTGLTRMRDGVPIGQVIRDAQAMRRALAEVARVDGIPRP